MTIERLKSMHEIQVKRLDLRLINSIRTMSVVKSLNILLMLMLKSLYKMVD